jgi:hypothetical protein
MTKIKTDISQKVDIEARRGDSFNVVINVKDAAGTAYDFSGYDGFMEIRGENDSFILGFTTLDQTALTAGSYSSTYKPESIVFETGKITLTQYATNMEFAVGTYSYDFQIKDSNNVQTWLYGRFKLIDDVTTA